MTTTAGHQGTAADPGTNPALGVRSTADGTVAGHVPDATPEHIHQAVRHLRTAQPEPQTLRFVGQRVWKRRFRNWLHNDDQLLLELVRAETGKGWGDLDDDEIAAPSVDVFDR